MATRGKDIVLAPLADGNQKYAIRSNADVVCLTGPTGGGKSYALYYAPMDYLSGQDNAKIVCFMRNVSDFWGAGKVNDTLKQMYPLIDRSVKKQPHDPVGEIIRNQTDMGMKLYNGSEIKFQQLDNENPIVIDKIVKGLQAKKLIFDECNKFTWRTITSFFPRLRADSTGKAQVFLAQNPERECFMRRLCGKGPHGGGWINDDGTVDKDMEGRVMFFNMQHGDLDRTYFGRTKREVYEKCKDHIDALIAKDPDMTYEDFILSMVFFSFSVRDNKAMLARNKRYRGLAANSATAASSHEENWNYSITDDDGGDLEDMASVQVSAADVERMFRPIELPDRTQILKRFMTVDFATTGFDNIVLKSWDLYPHIGFYCTDIDFCTKNTNKEGVIRILDFKNKHGLEEREMILDVQGFGFLEDCFPRAIKVSGAAQPTMRSKLQFRARKDEMAHLAMQMIQCGLIHYAPPLANMRYTHHHMRRTGGTTILRHMLFERVMFQFTKTPNGRIVVMTKEDMKKLLKGMSPDLFDNVNILCGGAFYDCYRLLNDEAGRPRQRLSGNEMLTLLRIDDTDAGTPTDTRLHKTNKIKNATDILNILSTI